VELADVYDLLVPLGVQGAYQEEVQSYQNAIERDPTNPELPLLLARLQANEDLKGNLTEVESLLKQSLTLKNNYTDGLLFAEQLAVAENDLPTATAAAKAAVASDPTEASYWFQLGLFYYAGADYQDAATALKEAVTLVPNYANAQYFLGLSLYQLKDTADAIAEFQALAQSNPGNSEVTLILSNLQAGKDPFAGATPPVTSTPQSRAQAPVAE
jgi:tetratricopeptide (TPR) repeat protein